MEQLGTAVAELFGRIAAVQPPLELGTLAVTVAIAVLCVLLGPIWRVARHGVTIIHEAGHGLGATLTGRRLAGIRLHSDTSGVTVSVGRPRGFGMGVTLIGGYTAPALVGLGAAWLIGIGHAVGLLWALLGMLLLVLVQIRNWFGLWTVLLAGFGVFALTWWLPSPWQSIAATAVSAFLLVAAVRTVFELQGARRRERSGDTDADQLGRISSTPPILWVGVFLVIALGAALVGGALLLRLPLSVALPELPPLP
ncbi:M50 family metallopeptidase [Naasia lichenicola]|uniref:M50 family metallopeptidase n=1 Tax=Naasia lichenicola TaxID=2565933 RepID=UPI0018EE4FD0|nr:M50 family metallopeptidase [Naasia lichenicola]